MDKIVSGDPETRSADVVAENLERLKVLCPEAFVEGKVDFDALRQLLGSASIACLDEAIGREDAAPLALGMADWRRELAPAVETTVVFLDREEGPTHA